MNRRTPPALALAQLAALGMGLGPIIPPPPPRRSELDDKLEALRLRLDPGPDLVTMKRELERALVTGAPVVRQPPLVQSGQLASRVPLEPVPKLVWGAAAKRRSLKERKARRRKRAQRSRS